MWGSGDWPASEALRREHQSGTGPQPGEEGLPAPASALEGSGTGQAAWSSAVTEAVRLDAEKRLLEGWTPEIISARARLEGRAWVCKETIYKHVYVRPYREVRTAPHRPVSERSATEVSGLEDAQGGDGRLPCVRPLKSGAEPELFRRGARRSCPRLHRFGLPFRPQHAILPPQPAARRATPRQPVASVALATGWRGGEERLHLQ
jgi:hypothetical protein